MLIKIFFELHNDVFVSKVMQLVQYAFYGVQMVWISLWFDRGPFAVLP